MKIFILLPIAVLFLGLFFGMAGLYRALAFLVCWTLLSIVMWISLVACGFFYNDPIWIYLGFMIQVLLMMPSIWLATLFSFATSEPVVPSPAARTYEVYSGLDDRSKARLHHALGVGLGIFARVGSNYLREKGHVREAEVLGEMAKRI